MTMVRTVCGRAAVERARGIIGTRFRPQGRDARFGIDCVGLILLAFRLPASAAPRDYALRGSARSEVERMLGGPFRRVARRQVRVGDVMLLKAATDVLHLAVKSETGMVHADVAHGVVERPGVPPWPLLAVFRRRVRGLEG